MKGDMTMEKIASVENLPDPFTKTLSTRVFDGHRGNLGVRWFPTCFRASKSLLGL